MFGLGKKGRAAKMEMKKMGNRDLMQALAAAAILVAGADGELEASELEKVGQVMKANPNLADFGGEIDKTLADFKAQLTVSFRTLKLYAMKEISEVKHSPEEAAQVLIGAITISEADGEIEDKEKKVLQEIANALNLSLDTYL